MSRERVDLFAWLTATAIGVFVVWAWRHHAAYDRSWDETVMILAGREVARGVTPPGDLLPGDEFAIIASVPLEADAPPGRYRLLVRVYDPQSGRSGSDTVLLTPLLVEY